MLNLKDLLSKFSQIEDPKKKREEIALLCSGFLGIDSSVLEKDIEVRNHVLYIKTHPAIRQKIFQRKIDLLQKISTIPSLKDIVDIR